MTTRGVLFFVLSGLLFFRCTSEQIDPDPSRVGYDFFPLAVGNYQVYQVEETEYKLSGDVIRRNYQLKVAVVDSFLNQEGANTFITHRFERETAAGEWQFITAWPTKINASQAILVEDNTPFIKISFPIAAQKTWDGNALNSLELDEYEMDSINSTYITPNNDTITSTLTVIMGDNMDFTVELDRRYELYARNIGLVYKEDISLKYCAEENCLGQQKVKTGREYRQYLIDYGQN